MASGGFGENLTITGYLERDVRIGDRFLAGTSVLQVTKPREPCYKMNARFGRDDAVKLFAAADAPGFYCRVLAAGHAFAGGAFERIETQAEAPTVLDAFRRRMHRA